MLALAVLYALSLALMIASLLIFCFVPGAATRITASLTLAELVILAVHTLLLATVFLFF